MTKRPLIDFVARRLMAQSDGWFDLYQVRIGNSFGLYRAIAGQKEAGGASQMDLLWVLNLADGQHTLLAMADRAGVPFPRIQKAAALALEAELIREVACRR